MLTVSNGSGLTKFRYVGGTTQIAQARDLNNTILYNVGTSFAGEALIDFGPGGANQRYYGINGHRDLTWTADTSGAVSATLRSDPWGIPGASSGGSLPSFRFQGSWYDTSSGLSWVVARWYAPTLGRFVSEDSILGMLEQPQSLQLMAYTLGDPVRHIDISGRYCPTCTPPWVGLKQPKTATISFSEFPPMRGKFVLGLFIGAKYNTVGGSVAGVDVVDLRLYGDDRLWSAYPSVDCYRARGCVTVNFETNTLKLRVNPSCGDYSLIFGYGWFGCEAPFRISTDFGCTVLDKCNVIRAVNNYPRANTVTVNWSISQSKMALVIYPANTVEGQLRIHLGVVNGRPKSVDQNMDGFPSNELMYYPPNGGTPQVLPRHWEGHWTDMAPWWGDWNKYGSLIK